VAAFEVRLLLAPSGESQRRYENRATNNRLKFLTYAIAYCTSSIALIIGILGIVNSMAMSAFSRTREIASLRALGWKSRKIKPLIAQCSSFVCGGFAA
jgi:ABC-type antimicrobial peptide transport system permease subunit